MQRLGHLQRDMNRTLEKQVVDEQERRLLDLADRKAKTITTLPILEKSMANHGTDPVMGLGEVVTDKQRKQWRKMKHVLSENIQQRVCSQRPLLIMD